MVWITLDKLGSFGQLREGACVGVKDSLRLQPVPVECVVILVKVEVLFQE